MEWLSINTGETPKPGQRIALKLPDGRVCSCIVTEKGGLEIEHVDSMDLVQAYFHIDKLEWFLLT